MKCPRHEGFDSIKCPACWATFQNCERHGHRRGDMSFDSLPPQYGCQNCGVMFSEEWVQTVTGRRPEKPDEVEV